MAASKAAKAGAWAGAATLATALAAAYVQVRPVLSDVELAKAGKLRLEADLEEIRRHAIDKPVRFDVIGTSRGVVELAVFETGCVRVASANRLQYVAASEHQVVAAAKPAAAPILAAGAIGVPVRAQGAQCWQPADGQCAIPPTHPTWDATEPQSQLPDGALLVWLRWAHGCVLEAKFYPQTGQFIYLRWLSCCSHG